MIGVGRKHQFDGNAAAQIDLSSKNASPGKSIRG
jgi:hypothetical protein